MKFKDIKKVPLWEAVGNKTYKTVYSHSLHKLPKSLLIQLLDCLLASDSERSAYYIRLLNKRFKPEHKELMLYALRNYKYLSANCFPVLIDWYTEGVNLKTIAQDLSEPASDINYALTA